MSKTKTRPKKKLKKKKDKKLKKKDKKAKKKEKKSKDILNGLPEMLTTGMISKFLGVSQLATGQWIDKGAMKSSNLPPTSEGRVGRRRVRREDFLEFLQKYNVPIERIREEAVFTTTQIAKAAGVSNRTPVLWIDRGYLKCFNIVSKRRLVFEKDVVEFFKKNNLPMKKLNKMLEKKKPGLPKRSKGEKELKKKDKKKSKKKSKKKKR